MTEPQNPSQPAPINWQQRANLRDWASKIRQARAALKESHE